MGWPSWDSRHEISMPPATDRRGPLPVTVLPSLAIVQISIVSPRSVSTSNAEASTSRAAASAAVGRLCDGVSDITERSFGVGTSSPVIGRICGGIRRRYAELRPDGHDQHGHPGEVE